MKFFAKHQKIWVALMFIAGASLVLSSFLPFILSR